MVERYDGEQLPPAHPVPGGPLPLADGDRYRKPPATPQTPTRRELRLAVVIVALVVAAIILRVLR